ncbi:MAG: dihydropteroate synthase [Gammaproteobacteria bacterium]|nr:dihydropteroate synthase [Gammaproteobacteria bacterium]
MTSKLLFADQSISLDRPLVMGILNVTPDSFSDGACFHDKDAAIRQASKLVNEGADILDVGGESTRPGAAAVSIQEELDRVLPVVEAIISETDIPISVDTSKPEVMDEVVRKGAGMINDVRALREPGAIDVMARYQNVAICLMHMQGEPRTMQANPEYGDVVADVKGFLSDRIEACVAAGVDKTRLVLDPGFGFGKTLGHNLQLLNRMEEFQVLGCPVLAGISRKSMIGAVLNDAPVDQRLYGSLSAAVIAAMKGADIVRVHDVKPTADALKLVAAIQKS